MNETNETLFFLMWNQRLRPPNFGGTSQRGKKCGILPHGDGRRGRKKVDGIRYTVDGDVPVYRIPYTVRLAFPVYRLPYTVVKEGGSSYEWNATGREGPGNPPRA